MIPQAALERYVKAGAAAGCPADQMANLLRAGVILHPKQLQFCAAARICDRDGGPTRIGWGGARGGGKSFGMLAQMGVDDCQRYPGLKCLLLRKIGKANKEAFEDMRQKLFASLPYNYKEREGKLEFGNGSRIILGNFKDERDIDQYLGIEYDEIGIEEATTLSDQKKRDIRGSLRSSKPGWRPREYDSTNPGGISHQSFKKEFIIPFRENRQTDTLFIPATVDDNPSVNKEYRLILEKYTGWQRRAWLEGDWDIESGQYFTNFRYEEHVQPRSVFDLPTTWDVWGSLDHGLTHFTVFYLMARSDDGHIWILDEHAERNWVPQQHCQAIHSMLARWEVPYKKLLSIEAGADVFAKKVDGDEISSIADQYAKHGIILSRANNDRITGALELCQRLGNRVTRTETELEILPTLTILDSCPRLIECIPSMQRDPKEPEKVLKVDCDSETGEGGDDFYDSARYGILKFGAKQRFNSGPSVVGPKRDFATFRVR